MAAPANARLRWAKCCAARLGVTDAATEFSAELAEYLGRCRAATELLPAVGLGVRDENDMEFLRGWADIAAVDSHSIRMFDEQGIPGIGWLVERLVAVSAK